MMNPNRETTMTGIKPKDAKIIGDIITYPRRDDSEITFWSSRVNLGDYTPDQKQAIWDYIEALRERVRARKALEIAEYIILNGERTLTPEVLYSHGLLPDGIFSKMEAAMAITQPFQELFGYRVVSLANELMKPELIGVER